MPGLLFVSQAMLDAFAAQGRIDLCGNVMTVVAGDGKGRRYALEPAVRFLAVVDGAAADPHALLHKVKSMAQLRGLGAEPLGTSCVLGEVAYDVQPGYLADGAALEAASAGAPAAPPGLPAAALGGAPLPANLEERRKEAEALARFLLETLSS